MYSSAWPLTYLVYLELVNDLSINAFIAALKWFISKIGIYRQVYCDNSTNTVGTTRRLTEVHE